MKKYMCLLVVAVLATALFGCGAQVDPFKGSANMNPIGQSMSDKLAEEASNDLAEKIIEGDSGVDVEIAGGAEESVAWPKGVSSDAPEFKYGKIELTLDDGNNSEDSTGVMIQIVEVDSDGFEKYLADLETAGFVVEEEFAASNDISNKIVRKGNIRVTVTNNPIGDNTMWIFVKEIPAE